MLLLVRPGTDHRRYIAVTEGRAVELHPTRLLQTLPNGVYVRSADDNVLRLATAHDDLDVAAEEE